MLRMALLLLFFSFAYADCDLSVDNTTTPKTYALCQNVSSDVEMYWSLPAESATIDIAFRFSTDAGWVGAGFSHAGQMDKSQVLLGWFNQGVGEVHEYELGQYILGSLSTKMGLKENATIVSIDGRAIIYFTRSLNSEGAIPINSHGANWIVWGLAPTVPSSPTNVPEHTKKDAKQISLKTGAATKTEALISKDSAKTLHAVLMSLTFLAILPSGVLIARYLKPFQPPLWFKLHQTLQWIGVVAGGIAFIIALDILSTGYYKTHRVIGILTMSLAFFQPFNAFFRPHPPKQGEAPTPERKRWNLIHWWSGRLCCVLGIINCYIGLNVVGADTAWTVLVSIFLFVLLLIGLFLSFNKFAAERTQTPAGHRWSGVQATARDQAHLLSSDPHDSDDDK